MFRDRDQYLDRTPGHCNVYRGSLEDLALAQFYKERISSHALNNIRLGTIRAIRDANGKLAPGGIQAEAEQMMLIIEAALARRGLALENVVKCTVFQADIAEWSVFNEVYKKQFRTLTRHAAH